jgi:scyllo-inositol 2-dehydrogenase (NADP+)
VGERRTMGNGNLINNVVVVGFGMGFNPKQYHCNTIRTTKGLNLYGVCDIEHNRREEAKKEYDIKTYADFDEVLDDDNVDLVIIATPNVTHAPMTIKALDAGKHVVTEKIMCLNVREADAMIEASKRNNRMLSIRQNRRWDTDFVTVKQVIDDGMLGDIFSIDSAVCMFIKPNSWRARKEAGGGYLYDWGCHVIDQVVLLAKSEPTTVFAVIESRVWDVDVDTHARVLTIFENGLVTEVEVSNISWLGRPRWHIRGEKGALTFQCDKALVKTANGTTEIPSVFGNLREFYQNIASVLNDGAELLVKPQEVRTSVAIIESAFLSAQRGESVTLSKVTKTLFELPV